MQQREQALQLCRKNEETRLKESALQQRNRVIQEKDAIIAEQTAIKANAEKAIASLGALKFLEKSRKKVSSRKLMKPFVWPKAKNKWLKRHTRNLLLLYLQFLQKLNSNLTKKLRRTIRYLKNLKCLTMPFSIVRKTIG